VRLSHCGPTWRMYTINHGSEGGGEEWVGEGGEKGRTGAYLLWKHDWDGRD